MGSIGGTGLEPVALRVAMFERTAPHAHPASVTVVRSRFLPGFWADDRLRVKELYIACPYPETGSSLVHLAV